MPDAKGRGKVVLGKCPSRARIRRCPGDRDPIGEMAERFKAPVLKTGEGLNLPWVRIPLSPPVVSKSPWEQGLFCFYSLRYPPVYPSTCKGGAFDRTRYRSRLSRQISPTTARSSGWLCWTRKRQLACGRVRQGGRCDGQSCGRAKPRWRPKPRLSKPRLSKPEASVVANECIPQARFGAGTRNVVEKFGVLRDAHRERCRCVHFLTIAIGRATTGNLASILVCELLRPSRTPNIRS